MPDTEGRKRLLSRRARDNLRKRLREANLECRLEDLGEIHSSEGSDESSGETELVSGGQEESGGQDSPGPGPSHSPEQPQLDNVQGVPSPPPSPSSSSSSSSSGGSSTPHDSASSSDENGDRRFQNLNEEERNQYLIDSLRDFAMRGITKTKVDDMLRILRPFHPFLPKSSKTLLKTPRTTEAIEIGNGLLWYKGIGENLKNLPEDYFISHENIEIDINIDGLPIFACSDKEFWPILGCVKNIKEPFIIGIYHGVGKPNNVHTFLQPYINDVSHLKNNGFDYHGTVYPVIIRDYILDAPARAFIKQCVGHSGYYACEKCTIPGRYYMARMTFMGFDHPLRTDQSFLARENPNHHKDNSPLEILDTGMVSQFRLDSLHLVYVGVVKRMVSFLFFRRATVNLPDDSVTAINNFLDNISNHFPMEFNRLPRSLGNDDKKSKLKATEYRRLALYDFVVVMKDNCPIRVYRCFVLLHLHCALTILCSSRRFQEMNDVASFLLQQFIKLVDEVFGTEFVVYNVHSLLHLPQECLDSGRPLDDFSSFKFENYLKTIKQTLKSPVKPLQQVARRDMETCGKLLKPKDPVDNELVKLTNKHARRQEEYEEHIGPPLKKVNVNRMVMQYADHSNDWSTFEVKLLHKYSSYYKADKACNVAEEKTDIDTAAGESDVPGRRKTRKPRRYESDSEEERPTSSKKARCILSSDDDDKRPTSSKKTRCVVSSDDDDEENLHAVRETVKSLLEAKSQKGSSEGNRPKSSIEDRTSNKRTITATQINHQSKGNYELSSSKKSTSLVQQLKVTTRKDSEYEDREMNIIPGTSQTLLRKKNKKGDIQENNFQERSKNCSTTMSLITAQEGNDSLLGDEAYVFLECGESDGENHSENHGENHGETDCENKSENNGETESLEIPPHDSTSHGLGSSSESPKRSCPFNPSLRLKDKRESSVPKDSPPPPKKSDKSITILGSPSGSGTATLQLSSLGSSDRLMLKSVLWQYEEINSKLDFIIARQELLQRSIKPEEDTLTRPKGLPSFPLFCEDSLESTEKYLKSDINFKLTMLYLQAAYIDGFESVTKATQAVLKKVISNRLARIISYSGTKGKKVAFSQTQLLECILCAIKSVFKKGEIGSC
ncbi:Supervillin [Frankliniella fusca]|uniref:Supervillin n=1 Tax=Frankliniella fusca TaxID=407009 RepID=A0AAE1LI55_9NEOP|nr:Supervillin [Frankliniella fusca]